MKSWISAARCSAAWHTPTTLGHSSFCGGSHWHVSWGQTEVYPLPIACNSCCKLNLLGLPPKTQCFLCISWCMFNKSSKALHTWFMFLLFAWAFLICWGKKRPLMYEVGLNSPEPNSPKVTHCFRVLYLRVGLGLDGAVFIFLLSAALLISEKNNQPICSMLRNKNNIISTFQMKATTKKTTMTTRWWKKIHSADTLSLGQFLLSYGNTLS